MDGLLQEAALVPFFSFAGIWAVKGLGAPASDVGVMFALAALAGTATGYLGGRLSDRVGRKWLIAAGMLWLGLIGAGLRVIWGYENSPGVAATPANYWPVESRLERTPGRATLVMLAHPHCPCTRASMGELAQVMARLQGKVAAYVLFYTPRGSNRTGGSGLGWENTELRRTAGQIPGVTVLSDVDGAEARRFGAETSGHTLLFDSTGRLLFNGGITGSRGHSGDNVGESAIVSNRPLPVKRRISPVPGSTAGAAFGALVGGSLLGGNAAGADERPGLLSRPPS